MQTRPRAAGPNGTLIRYNPILLRYAHANSRRPNDAPALPPDPAAPFALRWRAAAQSGIRLLRGDQAQARHPGGARGRRRTPFALTRPLCAAQLLSSCFSSRHSDLDVVIPPMADGQNHLRVRRGAHSQRSPRRPWGPSRPGRAQATVFPKDGIFRGGTFQFAIHVPPKYPFVGARSWPLAFRSHASPRSVLDVWACSRPHPPSSPTQPPR